VVGRIEGAWLRDHYQGVRNLQALDVEGRPPLAERDFRCIAQGNIDAAQDLGRSGEAIGKLERETGFEPATSSLGSWHSTPELLPLREKLVGQQPVLFRKVE
jgi:hypothetical protein